MNAAEVYTRLGRLAEESETVLASSEPDAFQRWSGKVYAVMAGANMSMQAAGVSVAMNFLKDSNYIDTHLKIRGYLLQALAMAELNAPLSEQGAFVQAGNGFDAMAAVAKVMSSAKSTVRIVDPYMDEKALTHFAVLANEGTSIELLSDTFTVKPSLAPAVARWKAQHGSNRPLDARISVPRALHDRLIIIDGRTVYSLTQSLADFAARSPASILRDDGSMADLKVAAYDEFWQVATVVG